MKEQRGAYVLLAFSLLFFSCSFSALKATIACFAVWSSLLVEKAR